MQKVTNFVVIKKEKPCRALQVFFSYEYRYSGELRKSAYVHGVVAHGLTSEIYW